MSPDATEASEVPKLLIESSAALSYLKGEPDGASVAALIESARAGRVRLAMARTGWGEIEPRPADPPMFLARYQLYAEVVGFQGDVARADHWVLGVDVLGDDDTPFIDENVRGGTSLRDRNQLLAASVGGYWCLVSHDTDFTQRGQNRERVLDRYGLRVLTGEQALECLRSELGIG